jgi:lipopolysaccharide/colanic/teichoic acid biosynthesis glycosyltransferase
MTSVIRVAPLDGEPAEAGAACDTLVRPRLRLLPPFSSDDSIIDGLATAVTWQKAFKRGMDIVLAVVLLILTLPVLVDAAIAIKLQDGGPVLFRQERVGKDGKRFVLYKLRSMVPDAEAQLPRLRPSNHRDGPLFKLSNDPRVTRVGRFLRSTSIDELPQLVAVLAGRMSMVGPRPALPEEVAQFDEPLLKRLQVLPGITGLWQVEARDDPSFESYRRFDLYYIRYWSLRLDVAIVFLTGVAVLHRSMRALGPRGRSCRLDPVIVLD